MPVLSDTQRRLVSEVNNRKHYERRCERLETQCKELEKANAALIGEVETLRGRLDRFKRILASSTRLSIKRAKMLDAVQAVLNGEVVYNTEKNKCRIEHI